MRRGELRRIAVCLAAVLCIGATAGGDERPLPDTKAFAREVRVRLRPDRELQSEYTYLERREEIRITKLGDVTEGPVKVYEVYPSIEPGRTYKRLISVDGVPLSRAELEKADRKHAQDLRLDRQRRALETADERARRLRKEADEQRERAAVLDEIFEAFDIRLVGREIVDGHSMVVATLEPKATHRPRTDEGKLMKKIRARAWVSESDYQIARAEVEVIEDVTVGWGIVGRLHAGTRGTYERRKINGEIWLPSRETVKASGRALVFRKFRVDTITEWSGYRRVSPEERGRFTDSGAPRPLATTR